MHLTIVGLNHKTAPVQLRERVSFSEDARIQAMHDLKDRDGVAECMILSTCNRTEIVAVFSDKGFDPALPGEFLAGWHKIDMDDIAPHLYRRTGPEAVTHLFRVTCGLDSMVIGETQIASQVKDAYSCCVSCRANGPIINKLLHRALEVNKKVRNATRIGEGSLSVSFVACEVAEKIFKDLAETTILLVGAGETGELTARHLRERGALSLFVTNRTAERAEQLAEAIEGKAVPFERMAEFLANADILISSTASTEPVITTQTVKRALEHRGASPLFLIDLAVPRDIEEEVNDLNNVFLYNIDDLQEIVDKNLARRQAELSKALRVVDEETEKFLLWQKKQAVSPTIREMQELFEGVRVQEMERLRKQLSEEDFQKVETATKCMMKKILQQPILRVKDAATRSDSGKIIDAIRDLLGLREE